MAGYLNVSSTSYSVKVPASMPTIHAKQSCRFALSLPTTVASPHLLELIVFDAHVDQGKPAKIIA